jgi:hypothetical protein
MVGFDPARTVITDCAHAQTRVEVLPPGEHHYARRVCCACNKQLCWEPNPLNVERRKINAARIQKLLNDPRLSEWEAGFVRSLTKSNNLRLSPRQQAILNSLVENYLIKDNNDSEKRSCAPLHECAA